MSDALAFDVDGYVDMEQFPDDGTEVDDAVADDLRDRLLADPVDEPTAADWDAMCSDAVADTDPFEVDESPFPDAAGDGVDPAAVTADDLGAESLDPDPDDPLTDDGPPDVDDGGDPFELDDPTGTDPVDHDPPEVDVAGGDATDGADEMDLGEGIDGLF